MPLFTPASRAGKLPASSHRSIPGPSSLVSGPASTPAALAADTPGATHAAPLSTNPSLMSLATKAEHSACASDTSPQLSSSSTSPASDAASATSRASPADAVSSSSRVIWLLDTETTGLSPTSDRVVEIAVLQYAPRRDGPRAWLVHPGRHIPASVSKIHGITNAAVADAQTFAGVWGDVLETVAAGGGDRPLVVAHNATFDRGFVEAELARAGKEPPAWDWACSISKVARAAWPGEKAGLGNIAERLGIGEFGHHRAGADVEALAVVLDAAGEVLGEKEGRTGVEALVAALERSSSEMNERRDGVRAAGDVMTRSVAGAPGEMRDESSGASSLAGAASSSAASVEGTSAPESVVSEAASVYCVRGGKVWHKTLQCGSLARSKEIDALSSPPEGRTPCSLCAKPREPEACCVCTEPLYGAAGEVRNTSASTSALPCGHVLHTVCIAAWTRTHRSCPICRMACGVVGEDTAVRPILPTSPVTPARTAEVPVAPPASGRYVGSPYRRSASLYGTEQGECYHVDPSCHGLRRAIHVQPVSADGRRPCRVCIVDCDVAIPSRRFPPSPLSTPRRLQFASRDLDSELAGLTAPRASRSMTSAVARSREVFVAPTGTVWHTTRSCSGLRKAGSVSAVTSVPGGRRPCKLCAS